MNNSSNLMLQFEEALNQIGASMMTDDFACKLLAWLNVIGGYTELTVINPAVNGGIQIAQKKLNIYGGEIPNQRLMPMLLQRIQELKSFQEETTWLDEIYDRYPVLKPNKKK